MTAETLPPDVRVLLHDRIETFEELEVLLFLVRTGGAYTVEGLEEQFNVPPSLLDEALAGLVRASLLTRRPAPEATFQYAPATKELDSQVQTLAAFYKDSPIAVMRFMSASAVERVRTSAIRTFGDAFLIRRDKKDD